MSGVAIKLDELFKKQSFTLVPPDYFLKKKSFARRNRITIILITVMLIIVLVLTTEIIHAISAGAANAQIRNNPIMPIVQNIDIACADIDSAKCASFLNQIEPCGNTVEQTPTQILALNKYGNNDSGCSVK